MKNQTRLAVLLAFLSACGAAAEPSTPCASPAADAGAVELDSGPDAPPDSGCHIVESDGGDLGVLACDDGGGQ